VISDYLDDETLPTINILKHRTNGKTRNKMEGPTSKKTNEPPKRANHKGNIKFLQSREAYHIMKGEDLLKGSLAYTNPHLLQQHISK
jgi:hypothetical protein